MKMGALQFAESIAIYAGYFLITYVKFIMKLSQSTFS